MLTRLLPMIAFVAAGLLLAATLLPGLSPAEQHRLATLAALSFLGFAVGSGVSGMARAARMHEDEPPRRRPGRTRRGPY